MLPQTSDKHVGQIKLFTHEPPRLNVRSAETQPFRDCSFQKSTWDGQPRLSGPLQLWLELWK